MDITIPIPQTISQWFWLLLSVSYSIAFAKDCDETIISSKWYSSKDKITKFIISAFLSGTHHYLIGLFLIAYASKIGILLSISSSPLIWIGWGLVITDIRDMYEHIKKVYEVIRGGE